MRRFAKANVLVALLALIPMALAGCNGEDTARLEVGDRFQHEQISTQVMYQNFMGAPQDLEHKVTTWMTQTVDEIHDDGSWSSTITFDRAKVRLKSQQLGAFEYDTKTGRTPPEPARAFAVLVGKSIRVKTSKLGKIESVEGAAAIVDEIFDGLGVERNEETEDVYAEIAAQFGDAALSQQFSLSHPGLPAPPYEIGHRWKQVARVGGAYPTIMEVEYEVAGRSDGKVTVRSIGVARAAEDTTKVLDGVPITVVMQGSQTGELIIEDGTGVTLQTTVTQSLDGHVEMGITEELKAAADEAETQLPPALKIPTRISNEVKTTITRVE